jgi:hypothetical protein
MRSLAAALLLALVTTHASLASTWFSSEDIYRPLVPQEILPEAVYAQLFPQVDSKAAGKAFKDVKDGQRYFDITSLDDARDRLWVSRLLRASRLNPQDPYAACLLGAYFSLHHELEAAADASREALLLARSLTAESGREGPSTAAAAYLLDLQLRCGINLARSRLLLGDPEGALDELAELPAIYQAKSPVVQKAYWWVTTLARINTGDTAGGWSALREAEKVDSMAILDRERFFSALTREAQDYPQYFEHSRAVETYLKASILWLEGNQTEALTAAREAVNNWPKFYDGWLALGLFLVESGQVDEGLKALENLRGFSVRGKMMRPEAITYNLAKIGAEQGKFAGAETLYKDSIDQAEARNCDYFRIFAGLAEPSSGCELKDICTELNALYRCNLKCKNYESTPAKEGLAGGSATWLCESLQAEPFRAAHNNLGVLYLDWPGETADSRGRRLREALQQFAAAMAGAEADPEMWHRANLNRARAHLALAEREGFVASLTEGLGRPEAPVQAYLEVLGKDGAATQWPDAARLYLDTAEEIWKSEPPKQVRSELESLAPQWESSADADLKSLAERAKRLLGQGPPTR